MIAALRRLFRRPLQPPTQAEIEERLAALAETTHELATRIWSTPRVPADQITWYDAETTVWFARQLTEDLERRLPEGSRDRRRLADARKALLEEFDKLPEKRPRSS